MTRSKLRFVTALCSAAWLAAVSSAAGPGTLAPNFTGTDSNGKTETLAQYRGKYVVLEWANKDCPFDRAQYESGEMEARQREWTAKGVVWLRVVSSAPGQEGYVSATQENDYLRRMKATPTAAILDPSGTIGRLYEAKATPHMFVIDPQGKVIYQGAIDDKPTPDRSEAKGAKNYVSAALTEAMAGKAVSMPVTRAYGCSVKYGN